MNQRFFGWITVEFTEAVIHEKNLLPVESRLSLSHLIPQISLIALTLVFWDFQEEDEFQASARE
jgi:hypothetical protein